MFRRNIRAVLMFLMVLSSGTDTKAQTMVSIDSLSGFSDETTLRAGGTHVIFLRYDLTGAPTGMNYQPANAWIIYSPDGADWLGVQGTALSPFVNVGFDFTFSNHFNKTGGGGIWGLPQPSGTGNLSGTDTVGVLLAGVNQTLGNGLPSGFNYHVYSIQFSSDPSDVGLHICVDTSGQVPGGSWEWANVGGLLVPDWDGGRCFVVGCCVGKVGDINGEGGDDPTIGDIASLIDHLFITSAPLNCLYEADTDLSGTLTNPPLDEDDITIGDVSVLIDHLFISGTALPACP